MYYTGKCIKTAHFGHCTKEKEHPLVQLGHQATTPVAHYKTIDSVTDESFMLATAGIMHSCCKYYNKTKVGFTYELYRFSICAGSRSRHKMQIHYLSFFVVAMLAEVQFCRR